MTSLRDVCESLEPILLDKRYHVKTAPLSKPSASVSSGVPNTVKQRKTRGRRANASILSRRLEALMKPEARVFDMTDHA